MERGAKIVLSSGRMPAALKHIGDEIGVNAPAVCFNGGAVVNLQTGETLYQTPVPMDLARDIARAAEERGMYLHAFVHGGYIAPEYNDRTAAYERLSGVKATVVNRPVSEAMDEAPMKLLIIDTPEGAEAALTLTYAFAGEEEPYVVRYLDASINNYTVEKNGSASVTVSKDDCAEMIALWTALVGE